MFIQAKMYPQARLAFVNLHKEYISQINTTTQCPVSDDI